MKKRLYEIFCPVVFLMVNFIFIACFSTSDYLRGKTAHNAREIAHNEIDWSKDRDDVFCIITADPAPGDPVTVVFLPKQKNGTSKPPEKKLRAVLYSKAG